MQYAIQNSINVSECSQFLRYFDGVCVAENCGIVAALPSISTALDRMKKTTTCYLTDALDSYDDGTCRCAHMPRTCTHLRDSHTYSHSPSGTGASTPAFTRADNNECIAITDSGEVTINGVSRPVDPVWAAGFTRGCSGKLNILQGEFEVKNGGVAQRLGKKPLC